MTEQKLNPMKVVLINVRASFLSIFPDDDERIEKAKANELRRMGRVK